MPWVATVDESGEAPNLGPHPLYMPDVVTKLQERVPAIHADLGARHGKWHPYISTRQCICLGPMHLGSIDRGWAPMYPVWTTKDELRPVPLDYALKHEDFPVVDIRYGDLTRDGQMVGHDWPREEPTALVLRPVPDDARYIGWCELAWTLIKRHPLIGITPVWWAEAFDVPMDWMGTLTQSPIVSTFNAAWNRLR